MSVVHGVYLHVGLSNSMSNILPESALIDGTIRLMLKYLRNKDTVNTRRLSYEDAVVEVRGWVVDLEGLGMGWEELFRYIGLDRPWCAVKSECYNVPGPHCRWKVHVHSKEFRLCRKRHVVHIVSSSQFFPDLPFKVDDNNESPWCADNGPYESLWNMRKISGAVCVA